MINLTELVDGWAVKQKALDLHIFERFGLDPEDARDFIDELLLAYKVELGEAANNFRGFKFWSEDQEQRRVSKTTITADFVGEESRYMEKLSFPLLEELIDCVHFMVSIGNVHNQFEGRETSKRLYYLDPNGWQEGQEKRPEVYKKAVTRCFNLTFSSIVNYERNDFDYLHCIFAFQSLLNLTAILGYSLEDLQIAYLSKNAENHKRQESGY